MRSRRNESLEPTQDDILEVRDARGLQTGYDVNGLGDLRQLNSPDTGITNYTRNAAGNVHQMTDARNQTVTYTYDAADRATRIVYADQTIQLTYDQGAYGKGRLTQVSDASGSTHWIYDDQGRVATKQQVTGAVTLDLGYLYNAAGQLNQITTLSGQIIGYTYVNGRIQSVTVNSSTVLSGALYAPFGDTRGGAPAISTYDLFHNETQTKNRGRTGCGERTRSRIHRADSQA